MPDGGVDVVVVSGGTLEVVETGGVDETDVDAGGVEVMVDDGGTVEVDGGVTVPVPVVVVLLQEAAAASIEASVIPPTTMPARRKNSRREIPFLLDSLSDIVLSLPQSQALVNMRIYAFMRLYIRFISWFCQSISAVSGPARRR